MAEEVKKNKSVCEICLVCFVIFSSSAEELPVVEFQLIVENFFSVFIRLTKALVSKL